MIRPPTTRVPLRSLYLECEATPCPISSIIELSSDASQGLRGPGLESHSGTVARNVTSYHSSTHYFAPPVFIIPHTHDPLRWYFSLLNHKEQVPNLYHSTPLGNSVKPLLTFRVWKAPIQAIAVKGTRLFSGY